MFAASIAILITVYVDAIALKVSSYGPLRRQMRFYPLSAVLLGKLAAIASVLLAVGVLTAPFVWVVVIIALLASLRLLFAASLVPQSEEVD